MHVALSRNETQQNFNVWVYGDERLVRGSGLFVGETGIAANHHFLAPKDGSSFHFVEGRYRMDVYAQLLGNRDRTLLFSQTLAISGEIAAQLAGSDCGLYFDWGPDSSRYLPHVARHSEAIRSPGFAQVAEAYAVLTISSTEPVFAAAAALTPGSPPSRCHQEFGQSVMRTDQFLLSPAVGLS